MTGSRMRSARPHAGWKSVRVRPTNQVTWNAALVLKMSSSVTAICNNKSG